MNMGLRRTVFDIKGFFSVHWNLNRRLFWWIIFFMFTGVLIGVIAALNPNVTAARIGRNFIDGNILNAIAIRASFGSFIINRLLEFIFSIAFIFILCQTGVTSLFTFAFISFRTCSMTINLYWIIARLGPVGGGILFIFYLIFFLMLLAVYAAAIVYIMKQCACIRSYGFRRGTDWNCFFQTMLVFACIITCVAVLEWLCFYLIFSKILWPNVFQV
jgi:hypothetical protein